MTMYVSMQNTVHNESHSAIGQQHVVVGVVSNAQGEVLITLRPEATHQGGLWEFPRGMRELGETAHSALRRELNEEVGIVALSMRPLIQIHYQYPQRRPLLLDVWRVNAYQGEAYGREGQAHRWVVPDQLLGYTFPAANRPIIDAVRLPTVYLITPDPMTCPDDFEARLQVALQGGVRLLQLRAKSLARQDFLLLAQRVADLCQQYEAKLLLNADPVLLQQVDAAGVHLSGQALMQYRKRPVAQHHWLAASCHDAKTLRHASQIGVDFVTLSPVQYTQSHPNASAMGWQQFAHWVQGAHCPVYALGGLGPQHIAQAIACGGQGIAAIRALWGQRC